MTKESQDMASRGIKVNKHWNIPLFADDLILTAATDTISKNKHMVSDTIVTEYNGGRAVSYTHLYNKLSTVKPSTLRYILFFSQSTISKS